MAANRLLVGLGWSVVILIYWFKQRKPVAAGEGVRLELAFLILGAVYSLSLFKKGSIALYDTVLLFPTYFLYLWLSGKSEKREPDLVGPSMVIASLGKSGRKWAYSGLLIYAAAVILLSAEPFVDSLIETGRLAQIDEFIMIQWIAPLASESPEMLIAIYFTVRGKPGAALTMLISSTVNQWTLLVGSLPVAYSLSFGAPASLPLDWRQQVEFLLTMSQTLFAVLLVSRKTISWPGASLLLGLFVAQLVSSNTEIRLAFSIAFLMGTAAFFVGDKERRQQILQIPGLVSEAIRA